MRKIIQMLMVACLIVLSTQVAFANADKSTVQEGADLTTVKRMAIAAPLYIQIDDKAPNKDLLTQIEYDSSRVSHAYVVSYNTVAEGIKTNKGIDLAALDRRQAAKTFRENVADYADAYVVLTVANNSITTFFFDVFDAKTNQLLYTYEIRANRSEADSVATYTNYCEQFYKHFDREVDDQIKAASKKK